MGSGSSRSVRALRRRRGPDSPAVPEGRPGPVAAAAAAAAAEVPGAAAPEAADRDPGPAAPPDGREETLRLLDQLLAESAAWGPPEPARFPPAAGAVSVTPSPAARLCPSLPHKTPSRSQGAARLPHGPPSLLRPLSGAGLTSPSPAVSPGQRAEDQAKDGHTSGAPGSSHRPAISYDQAEEELMASIERECCG
ncbi:cystin-1 [Ctenodactylus gundi]